MKGPCLSSRELGLGAKKSWGAGEGLGGDPGSCVGRLREEAESVVEAAGPGGLVGGRGGCRCEGHCRGSDSRPGGHSGLGSLRFPLRGSGPGALRAAPVRGRI